MLSRLKNWLRGIRSSGRVEIAPLHFAGSMEALDFSCKITPAHREKLHVLGLILDAEATADGSVFVVVDAAAPGGSRRMLVRWPKDDTMHALAHLGCLCAVLLGPEVNHQMVRPAIAVAILDPVFLPEEGRWQVRKSLRD